MNYLILKNKLLYEDQKIVDMSFERYINSLALSNLKSLKTIRKGMTKNLGVKKNIPLYINKKILLMVISDDKVMYYINIQNLSYFEYEKGGINLYFKDHNSLKINISRFKYNQFLKISKKVIDYITLID